MLTQSLEALVYLRECIKKNDCLEAPGPSGKRNSLQSATGRSVALCSAIKPADVRVPP